MTIVHARPWIAGAALAALAVLASRLPVFHAHLLHPGDRLTAIRVQSLAGQAITLAPRGRPRVINVFATWCPPCRAEMPALRAFAARLRERGIETVGIDQEEDAARVSVFARDYRIRYPLFIDTTNVTHDLLGARVIPTTIFVDANGIIRWEHSGPLDSSGFDALAARVESAG